MITRYDGAKDTPSPSKHALAPGWAAFIGFTLHHADALGLVPAPFPIPLAANGSLPDYTAEPKGANNG